VRIPARRPAGFTLLEMLVVVLIIGIVTTFAVLSLGGDRRGEELDREAHQFAELLRLASEQTVLRGEEWGVQIGVDEYRFLIYTDQGWAPQEDDPLFRARTLAEGTELEVELEGRDIVLGVTGSAEESTKKDKAEAEAPKPTLFILSSGEVNPFAARFTANQTEQRFEVKADALGTITVEALEP
jgi:general secretion pathway protein H